jgi:hypothetical protein
MRLIASSAFAVALLSVSVHARSEKVLSTTACEIIANPPAFNHRLVKLTGTVFQSMEKFSLSVESCGAEKVGNWTGIWVEYGGRIRTGAKYCCGTPQDRDRPTDLEMEGVQTSLVENERFRAFDERVQKRPRQSYVHRALFFRG